ncbi:MAG: DegV family protein [Anaerolineaceae bacterium]|jgi:DegV family protein with EDD domain|nr:DegV family protein [Anaerolineaceae bacterium]
MAQVAIVTDSTAYIPQEWASEFKLQIAPLQVIWGEEQFRDGVDIQPLEFYEKLQTAEVMPSTSQATPGALKEIYKELTNQGFDIFSIHISSKLSGTIDSAEQAKAMLEIDNIEIFDSETTGMALGFQVLAVARAAANGASLKDVVKIAKKARENTGVLFAVNTLEFLHRGGRIGGGAAFLGTMLKLKPILEVREGKIEAAGKVRTMNKAVDKVIEIMKSQIGNRTPIRIAIQHANALPEAKILLDKVLKSLPEEDVVEAAIADVSPVIGTHTGPGVVGIAYMAGM